MRKTAKIFFFLFLCALPFIASAYYNPGQPGGFVNDYTGTLSATEKSTLENKLAEFEKEAGNELAVAIIKSLEGDTIENFAEKLFRDWGVGKADKDNGILVLIAKDDREMRIEVGYGLEGALTDAQSNWIINKVMKPAFQGNEFSRGINEAADSVIAATKGEYVPSAEEDANTGRDWEFIAGLVFVGFMWLSSILGRSKSWWLGGVLGAVAGVVLGVIKGFLFFGLVSIAVLLPLGLLFDFIVSRQYKAGKSRGHIPWWTGGGGWGGGKSGGFGGFGGGMSGGGGSSGRW